MCLNFNKIEDVGDINFNSLGETIETVMTIVYLIILINYVVILKLEYVYKMY